MWKLVERGPKHKEVTNTKVLAEFRPVDPSARRSVIGTGELDQRQTREGIPVRGTNRTRRRSASFLFIATIILASIFAVGCSEPSSFDVEKAVDLVTDFLQENEGEGVGSGPRNPGVNTTSPAKPGDNQPPQDISSVLDDLTVATEGSMSGYDREEFPHWASDAAAFGWEEPVTACDVRDTALIRDGNDVRVDEECRIYAGSWTDPDTTNVYTDPQDLDGDHLVPLAESWRSGASRWTVKERETYANAPGVVLSVDDGANQEKGDKGPEAWLPPNREYWCEYASRWTEIKAVWGMSVDLHEKEALQEILSGCT